MLSTRKLRTTAFALITLAISILFPALSRAQAALLMEEPYGFFGSVVPTGHAAFYFRNICAETPVKLRRCRPDEQGVVLSRYQGINKFDWVAIPLLPYLYSVENASEVPANVDHKSVNRLRNRYHEDHLLSLGKNLSHGNIWRGGWNQMVGLSYERRIFGFRFETTEEQDDAFIAMVNERRNRSHFYLLFNNCADFARMILNFYFPGNFQRSVFPDAGMTSPKQIAYKLERYARKHPEMQLSIFEIPQIRGYRHHSRRNQSIAESLTTTYAIPIALLNPYVAGGIFVDYLVRGHHHLIPKNPVLLAPDNLFALTAPARSTENPDSAGVQALSVVVDGPAEEVGTGTANSGLKEIKVDHE